MTSVQSHGLCHKVAMRVDDVSQRSLLVILVSDPCELAILVSQRPLSRARHEALFSFGFRDVFLPVFYADRTANLADAHKKRRCPTL